MAAALKSARFGRGSKAPVLVGLVEGPLELGEERLVEDLGDGEVVELAAPRHGDARVEVVGLGRAERHPRELLLDLLLRLHLAHPRLQPLDLLLELVLLRARLAPELLARLGDLLLDLGLLGVDAVHLRVEALAHRLAVVAQDRHLVVGVVVELELRRLRPRVLRLHRVPRELEELLVERERRVVGAEHLGRQPGHEALEVLVEAARVELVEDVVLGLLALPLRRLLDQPRHDLAHLEEVFALRGADEGDAGVLLPLEGALLVVGAQLEEVLVLDAVLAEELEEDGRALRVPVQRDVLAAQAAAADGVGLLRGVLLVARADREVVDEPQRHVLLHLQRRLGPQPLGDLLPDLDHVLLELARLLELLAVRLALEGRAGGHEDVLELAVDGVLVEGHPRRLVLVHHRRPRVPRQRAPRGARLHRAVDRDRLRLDHALHLAHLGVLAAAAEEAGGLDAEVSVLLEVGVEDHVDVGGLERLARLLDLGLLLLGQRLLLLPLLVNVRCDRLEVALLEVLDHVVLSEGGLEGGPKVFDEHLLCGVVGLDHRGVHGRDRLLLARQVHRPPVVPHLDAVGLVLRGEDDAVVLEEAPLLAVGQRLLLLPPLVDVLGLDLLPLCGGGGVLLALLGRLLLGVCFGVFLGASGAAAALVWAFGLGFRLLLFVIRVGILFFLAFF
mmetsp:Transcript_44536/g.93173  ORF Transcript_44536/g.93173 Transcript_44536/m.93173 type:complete len:672 (+) Transcript_44536:195-2210(+)